MNFIFNEAAACDLNVIERVFAAAKHYFRYNLPTAQNLQELYENAYEACMQVTPTDIAAAYRGVLDRFYR